MARLVDTEKTGKCSPLCLTKAVQKTVPQIKKERRHSVLKKLLVHHGISEDPEHWSLTDFLLQHPLAAQQLQQNHNVQKHCNTIPPNLTYILGGNVTSEP